jgi:hypothetical protein
MVVVFLATDGFDGAVQRISLLHGRASDPLASQLVRFIFLFWFAFGWDLLVSGSSAPMEVKAEFFTGPPSSTWLRLVVSAFASLAVAGVVALMSVQRLQYVDEVVQRRWLL